MPELDFYVPFPVSKPSGTGDYIFYSRKPSVRALLPSVGPMQSGEEGMMIARGWLNADQDASVRVQSFDPVSAAYVTMSTTAITSAGGPAPFTLTLPPGDIQIVANFSVGPTTWKHPRNLRLSKA